MRQQTDKDPRTRCVVRLYVNIRPIRKQRVDHIAGGGASQLTDSTPMDDGLIKRRETIFSCPVSYKSLQTELYTLF